jgi:hypothetical protein
MYDTIKIWFDSKRIERIESILTDVRETTILKTGEIKVSGNVNNMRLFISGNKVKLEGSLHKFYSQTNLFNLSFLDAFDAIIELGNVFGEEIYTGKVTRLDVAYNFEMIHPIPDYLHSLSSAPRTSRSIMYDSSTLYFKNTLRELVFYNKLTEQTDKKKMVPASMLGSNILRYEARYKKNLTKSLRIDRPVTVRDLTDPDFCRHVLKDWYEQYQNIQKDKIPTLKEPPNNVREWTNWLAAYAISDLKNKNYFDPLFDDYINSGPNRTPNYRLRQKLNNLSGNSDKIIFKSICDELDGKLEKTYNDQLQIINDRVETANMEDHYHGKNAVS